MQQKKDKPEEGSSTSTFHGEMAATGPFYPSISVTGVREWTEEETATA
jgi:hypothetical protein